MRPEPRGSSVTANKNLLTTCRFTGASFDPSPENAMAQKERVPGKLAMPNFNPAQFAEMGQKQVEALTDMQRELTGVIEEVNREWAARVHTEADLARQFAEKLSGAKSLPDAAAIYQEWLARRMEMFAEDSRKFVADSQKFMAATTRLFSNGWTRDSA